MWRRIKNFFRENDIFAVSFTFRYKKEDKFSTWQGGIITFIIVAIYLFFGIYYFIPFFKKKNFTLFYNTINLKDASPIILDIDSSNFSIGLECGKNKTEELNELKEYLDFKVLYHSKQENNSIEPNNPFFLDEITNSTLYKIKNKNKTSSISGRFGDPLFQYIEISLNSKKNSSEYISEIDRILFKNDCKLEFHYNDYTINYDKF